MCQNIYISSKKELPEIKWNEKSPGFNIMKVTHEGELKMLEPILHSDHLYEVLSFMGCSCGLMYGHWTKDDVQDHRQRVKCVFDFIEYLIKHKENNTLQIFSTMWDKFPETYESKDFDTSKINKEEFEVDEMIILNVK